MTPQPTRSDHAADQRAAFTGTLVPLALLALAITAAIVAVGSGQHAVAAVASWLVLLALVFAETRSRPEGPKPRSSQQKDAGSKSSRWIGPALVLWLLATASVGLGYAAPKETPSVAASALAGTSIVAVGLLLLFLLRYLRQTLAETATAPSPLPNWCRAAFWIVVVALASTCLTALGLIGSQKPVVQTMLFLSLLPALEWLIRTLTAEGREVSLAGDIRTVDFLFARLNPIGSLFDRLERQFGVDVRSTWALRFARRAVTPLAGIVILLGWLSTCLVKVDTVQTGIQERFGAPVSGNPLGPGLHLVAPWPIDRVHRIETAPVRSMTLGFSGPTAGASLLWTKQHAAEEHNLLLGDGRDLVTINALLQYKVQDPWVWHYGTHDPGAMLRVAAEQALLNSTVRRSLDGVLSDNTLVLARTIEAEIRRRAEDYRIGAEIVGLTLQGLHPPVQVAEDYQAVISAQHEREIAILASRSYEIETLQAARAAALQSIHEAEADAASRTGIARGEAESFRRLQAVYAQAPAPLEHRRRLQALERVLEGRSFVVIDDRIERDGGVLWFED